jgi:hypothetical protein
VAAEGEGEGDGVAAEGEADGDGAADGDAVPSSVVVSGGWAVPSEVFFGSVGSVRAGDGSDGPTGASSGSSAVSSANAAAAETTATPSAHTGASTATSTTRSHLLLLLLVGVCSWTRRSHRSKANAHRSKANATNSTALRTTSPMSRLVYCEPSFSEFHTSRLFGELRPLPQALRSQPRGSNFALACLFVFWWLSPHLAVADVDPDEISS